MKFNTFEIPKYFKSVLSPFQMNFLLKSFFRIMPSDYFARKYPVSVKGILHINNKIVLVKNERNEWEPPGGKIDPHETPEQCVLREIKEELNIDATIDYLLDSWIYKVGGKVNVLCVVYRCKPIIMDERNIKLSFEHDEYGLFTIEEIQALNMPGKYKSTIKNALENNATNPY
ncbi:MAG TPA: NUDIX hydrolase [Bacteroidia bacterium]|nr:NUDIX hydrolase [Bacteroidia bacterium]